MSARHRFAALVAGAVMAAMAAGLLLGACRDGKTSFEDAAGLGIRLTLERRTLDNGLTVLMVEDHTVPIVTYQTWFRVGSLDEQPGITGVSHLFEHLMFKGTPRYPAKQFFEQLEAKGAEVNAYTTRDYTVYFETFSTGVPGLLERAIDMEADRMAHLALDDETLNAERSVVFEERKMRTENSPDGRMQEALWELAFREHPYRWPVIGNPQDLLAMGTEDLKAFYRKHYVPANAAVVIVGDFRPDAAMDSIRKAYAGLPRASRPARKIAPEPPQKEERRLILRDPAVASEKLAQAYHVTAAENDDSYALDVAAGILFEGRASRAHLRLVEGDGPGGEGELAVAVAGTAYTPAQPGLFIVQATMKGGVSASRGEQALEALIAEVVRDGVSAEELTRAVRQLTVQIVDSVRTPYGLGQLLGTVQSIFGEPSRFARDLAKYTQVRSEDVRRVVGQYLVPANRSVVTLIPQR